MCGTGISPCILNMASYLKPCISVLCCKISLRRPYCAAVQSNNTSVEIGYGLFALCGFVRAEMCVV